MRRLAPLPALAVVLLTMSAEARLPFAPPPPAATAPAPTLASGPWFAFEADVRLERWADALDLPLSGTARVQIHLGGPPHFALALMVDAPELSIGGQPVGRLHVRLMQPFVGERTHGRLTLEGPAGQLDVEAMVPLRPRPSPWAPPVRVGVESAPDPTAPGEEPPSLLEAAQAAAAEWTAAPIVRIHAADLDLERLTDLWPRLALAGRLSGAAALDAAGARASVEVLDGYWRGGPLGAVRLDLTVDGEQTRLSARAGRSPSAVRLDARVPTDFDPQRLTLAWRDRDPLTIRLDAAGLTPETVAALERFHPAAAFAADLRLVAQGALDDLRVEGELQGTLRDGDAARPLVGRLLVEPGAQQARLRVGEPTAPLVALTLAARTDLVALRRADADPAAAPLEGALDLAVPLGTLMPYLPAAIHDPTGALTGRIVLSGTAGAPRLDGAAGVADGALTVVAANARLLDLDLDLRFEGDRARVETFGARSGRGRLSGAGDAGWTVTPEGHTGPLWSDWRVSATAALALDDVPLVRPGLPAGLLDARVALSATAGPERTVADVTVGDVDLQLTGFSLADARPIARNGAVRRRRQGALRRPDAWLAGEGELDLTLIVPDAQVQGDDTRLSFGGTIEVRRRGDDFTVEGGIDTRSGRFRLFDNAFDLTGGRFTIQGGTLDPLAAVAVAIGQAQLADVDTAPAADTLDPIIDVRAGGRVVETDVRVRIVGPSRRPSLMLESDPPLPEYQILTLLITGRVDAIDESNGEVRRQAAKLIDRFHNPSLARQLYDRLGVDKLGLKFGASVTNPILTVGKQINRRLYVETVYHHDAPPDANEKEARVEYRLSPRWTVDTVAGDAGEGSLGLFWQTSFGRPEAKEEPAEDRAGDEEPNTSADSN